MMTLASVPPTIMKITVSDETYTPETVIFMIVGGTMEEEATTRGRHCSVGRAQISHFWVIFLAGTLGR